MAVKGNRPKDIRATTLEGRVDAVIMKNEENGFAILKVKPHGENSAQHVSVKGPLAHINVGEEVDCTGVWESSLKYGWGFVVKEVKVTQPITHIGLAETLRLGPFVPFLYLSPYDNYSRVNSYH